MSFPIYATTEEAYIFGNEVLSSTDQSRLNATQTGCTVDLRDLTAGADETQQTGISITYHAASGNYTLALSDISGVLTSGSVYSGVIKKAGMIDIEIAFGVGDRYLNTAVKTQIDTALGTDTISELGVGTPAATPTLKAAVMLLYMALRNKVTSTDSSTSIYNSSDTEIANAGITESASQVTRTKYTGA